MATDRQIEANRLNAQKCTGPRTAEGKATSSQNALKTGLSAKSDVIATESRDEYETLIAEYYTRFNPLTPEERCLVDDLISAEWLGRRYLVATAAIWEYEFRAMKDQDMGLTFMRESEALGRAQRYITAAKRNFAQALKQLQSIRSKRIADPVPAQQDEIANGPLNPESVSFLVSSPVPRIPADPLVDPTPKNPSVHPEEENIPPIAA